MHTVTLTWLPALLGAITRDEEEFVTELRYVPEGWLGVAGALVALLIGWSVVRMYRTEGRRGSSTRLRTTLAVIRCAVLLALAVILLEPVRVRILRRWIDSYAVVLVDGSSSMDLADHYGDETEAARVRRAMGATIDGPIRRSRIVEQILDADNRRFLRELAEHNRLKVYSFSDEPKLLGTVRATRERPSDGEDDPAAPGGQRLFTVDNLPTDIAATGPATNIERALRRAVDSLGGAPVAAVVVLSDGGLNQGAPAEVMARYARDRRIPLHVVGVGDPASPRNVRVTEVLAPPNAFEKDPFSIGARLTTEGIDGQTFQVRLRERNATTGGEGRIVDTQQVSVATGGAVAPVSFERRQTHVGRFVYTVEVPPLEGESVADDNSRQVTVNVIDSRTRVLLIAGGPSWEYRFVSRLLERDDTFDVSCWLQTADLSAVRDGNTIIDHLPATAEELFEYDVIILMDPDGQELDEAWCRLVDTFVTEYGGGMLLSAARSRTPAFLRNRELKPLHDLLPVTPDPEADIVLNEIGHYQRAASPVEVPSGAYGHPIMRLADDPASNRLTWADLGDIYWHYPVLREKAAATVLLRHGDPRMSNRYGGHVLAAVQFVGAGRTAFLAFDSTWRWRRYDARLFDRFWVRLVRYLAEGKLLGGTKRGMLVTDSDEFALGDAVTVSARLLSRQYPPLNRDQVLARFSVDGHSGDLVLSARRDRPGWFEGRFVPDRTGGYRLSLTLPGTESGERREAAHE
ncbi:MAG: hypothetical protein ACE5EX_06005, partial [Phycisphaerae bacterium]